MNEDVFPIENGDFPMSCQFSGVHLLLMLLEIWRLQQLGYEYLMIAGFYHHAGPCF